MPIKIIGNKTHTIEIDGSKFNIKRVSPLKSTELLQKCRVKGADIDIDMYKWRVEVLEYALVGWDNVLDEEGKPIPFDKKLILGLPAEVVDKLEAEINSYYLKKKEKEEEELKNSETTLCS